MKFDYKTDCNVLNSGLFYSWIKKKYTNCVIENDFSLILSLVLIEDNERTTGIS